jgi:hypothetical protein
VQVVTRDQDALEAERSAGSLSISILYRTGDLDQLAARPDID